KDAAQLPNGKWRQHMFPGIYGLLRKETEGLFPIYNKDKELKREPKGAQLDHTTGLMLPFRFKLPP
ncbi:unnamed protein product, partial [marine sediment metagenome]